MKRGWDTTQRRELLVHYAHSGGPTPGPATSGDRVPTSKVRSSRRSDVGWMPGSQPTGAAILLGPGLRPISHKPPPLVLRIALSLQCLLRVCDHESLKQAQQTLRYLKSGNLILHHQAQLTKTSFRPGQVTKILSSPGKTELFSICLHSVCRLA